MDDSRVVETYLSRKPAKYSVHAGLLLTSLLFVFSYAYWHGPAELRDQLAPSRASVLEHHQYWRLLTGWMIHADLQHFLSNAPSFAFFTGIIYGYYRLTTCLSLVFAGGCLVHLLSLLTYPADAILTGASGVVYLLAGFWVTQYLFLERRYSVWQRLLRGIGFSLALLFPTTFAPEVSYRAHAIGFALGIAAAITYFLVRKSYLRGFEVIEVET